jgi:hypothetical protein
MGALPGSPHGWYGNTPAMRNAANVTVAPGPSGKNNMYLWIRYDPNNITIPSEFRPQGYWQYTCGCAYSNYRLLYGYIEIKMRAAPICANNSLWLNQYYDTNRVALPGSGSPMPNGIYGPGLYDLEVDLIETSALALQGRGDAWVADNNRWVWATPQIPWDGNHHNTDVGLDGTNYPPDWSPQSYDPSQDYHTYGFLWTPSRITWLIDGQVRRNEPNTIFHTPLPLILELESSAGWLWAGVGTTVQDRSGATWDVQASDFPSAMLVESVYVWQSGQKLITNQW